MAGLILHTTWQRAKESLQLFAVSTSIFVSMSLLGYAGRVEHVIRDALVGTFGVAAIMLPILALIVLRPRIDFKRPSGAAPETNIQDPLFDEVVAYGNSLGALGVKSIRKKFGMGFARAKNIIQQMIDAGILSETETDKLGRKLFVSPTLSSR